MCELSPIDARERLAECLFLKMERMDPCFGVSWGELDEATRDFYRTGVREILLERTLLNLATADSVASPATT